MKESSVTGQPTTGQPTVEATGTAEATQHGATAEQTSLLALSRRSRRASEQRKRPESDIETAELNAEDSGRDSAGKARRFRHWRRQRPFIGGVLVVLGGIELFFSGQLDTGNLHIQFGIEGLQATIIPIALVVLGLSAMFRPVHHMFYGIIALVLAVYSLIGVNLGGFLLGMLLATIGAILVVAWMGPREPKTAARADASDDAHASDDRAGEEETA